MILLENQQDDGDHAAISIKNQREIAAIRKFFDVSGSLCQISTKPSSTWLPSKIKQCANAYNLP
jgi:hypothetical protein